MKTGNNLVLPTGNSALKDWLQIRDRNDSERRSRIDDAPDRLTIICQFIARTGISDFFSLDAI